ncbi:BolA/IbaG family iron-sulfur metabolism protein [Blochmannia endosymbiont of Camponotus sp. C-003]|uniref:BolA family protein n=1 Tax=unclassified Candidatus Blochmanniella TaxID=711328 RepID=UPI0020246CC2|nr:MULTISPECIES: BolA/IbaG family iron-sulfur metabolism protein [unclassified Candidatus Blochmannia]URJ23182.1 BolA/IbaG family iron-sulfur metabolism protein [Blochmannia endosymbiont of Camponotus sp. C-003]URJ28651.1 BolA/IbaG family iron-sulfur metabolism protein [Blochmannia endosymbiont of Camponotus sp. C-046]
MRADEVKSILLKNLSLDEAYVSLCDNNYQIIAVSHVFYDDMDELERHKIIYAPLMKYILNNKIHSISIQAFNPKEWNKKRRLCGT